MRKLPLILCLVTAATSWSSAAPAQTMGGKPAPGQMAASTTPPQVLWLYREDVKPARGYLHESVEQQFASYWAKSGVAPFFALDALTGNANETMFVSGYPSWEAFEKDEQNFAKGMQGAGYVALAKQEAELVNGAKDSLAVFRDDLSYHADRVVRDLAQARYVLVITYRIKPGHGDEFIENEKTIIKTHGEANMDEAWLMYEVAAGAPMGTYLMFQPVRSLAEVTSLESIHKTYRDGLPAEVKKGLKQHAQDDIVMSQRDVYAINPKSSHPPKDFIAAAPDFWGRKELPMAGQTAPKKAVTKKTETKKP